MSLKQIEVKCGLSHEKIRALAKETTSQHLEWAKINGYLHGRVLDYGCGNQPYRYLVEDGKYFAYDLASEKSWTYRPMPGGWFDSAMLTYVLGYTFDPKDILLDVGKRLKHGGYVVGAYAISWSEIEPSYICAPTFSGVQRSFESVGFEVVQHEKACSIAIEDFVLPISATFVVRVPHGR